VPTGKPVAPTRAPTFPTPTRIPTSAPTAKPTGAPSFKPTPVPTSMPTFSKLFLLRGKLQRYLSSNLTQDASVATAAAIKVLYNEVVVAGQPTVLGGCNSWRVSTGSELTTTLITQIATSVTLYAYNDANNAAVSTSCADATAATKIINAVAKAGAFLANVTCGTHTWRVDRCQNARTAVCVDCANPCVPALLPANGTCNNQYTLNPCGTNGAQYGCAVVQPSLNVFRVLSATFRLNPAFIPPVVSAVTATTDKTTATVTVTMSTDGTAYCGQFAAGVTPTSAAQITGQNFVATSASSVATVKITGLTPSTTYALYCLSQSSLGTLASLATAITYRVAATTACCKAATLTLNVASLYQNSAASSAVSRDLNALPSQSLTINLAAGGVALVPANVTITSAYALATAFASIGTGSTGTVGTLTVTATLSGPSAAEYGSSVTFASGASVNVITLVTPLPPPTLSSVQFSSDGTALVATMSANSDQAQITAARWPCYQLFRFAQGSGLNGTYCSWTSLSSVQMSLDSNAAVLVGDTVTLKGGRVRAACSVTNTTKCQSWATTAKTATTVLAPTVPVVPKVTPACLHPAALRCPPNPFVLPT
jgi:hypothetical protein